MTESCVNYLKKCLDMGLVQSPCLEMGVGYEGDNNKDLLEASNIEYLGTDMVAGDAVDYIINFEDNFAVVNEKVGGRRFGTVLVFSVLEHTFDPIRVLDNACNLIREDGSCIVITPTVWPLHNYPYDCWRINPNFYEEYAKRRGLSIVEELFEYPGFHSVKSYRDSNGTYILPLPSQSPRTLFRSRVIHKLFNTTGRSMRSASHITTAVVFKKS